MGSAQFTTKIVAKAVYPITKPYIRTTIWVKLVIHYYTNTGFLTQLIQNLLPIGDFSPGNAQTPLTTNGVARTSVLKRSISILILLQKDLNRLNFKNFRTLCV